MNHGRRKFFSSIVGAGTLVIAGCSGPSGGNGEQEAPPKQVAWPKVSRKKLRGWRETGRRKSSKTVEKYAIFNVHSYQRTILYENSSLRNEVKKKTLGQFDQTLAMFFASHVDLEGNATSGATPGEIADNAVPTMRGEMKKSGIENIRQVTPTEPLPSVKDSVSREFKGYFPTPSIEKEAKLGEEIGTRHLEIESGRLPVAGFLTVWKPDRGSAFVVGGAYPAEDFDEADTISVTSGEGDGIDIKVIIDLGIKPRALRLDIVDLAESVSKSDHLA